MPTEGTINNPGKTEFLAHRIDGQFIRNVADDTVDESMVVAINQVGKAMGIQTIAERVETKRVLDKLSELGVEFAQGYYIARPG